MFNIQYVIGNRGGLSEMFDILLAKSVHYNYKTIYTIQSSSTDLQSIDLIVLLVRGLNSNFLIPKSLQPDVVDL